MIHPGATRLPPALHRVLTPFTWPYGWVVGCRNWLYDHGWLRRHRLPCRVISIGNLTVGGTGKTPVTIWVVERLLAEGRRVGVLSRGYRRRSRVGRLLVSDGTHLMVRPDEAGDEPFLIARRCPGAVVAVGGDRYRVGQWLLTQFPLDCLVLDDGFQHRSLYRHVDLVLVDATDLPGLRALLPAGRLREPLSSLGRASGVILTRADAGGEVCDIAARLLGLDSTTPLIAVRFTADGFLDVMTGSHRPVEQGAGKRAALFSGIGNPAAFRRLVEGLGVHVVEERIFADHHHYAESDLQNVAARARQAGAELLLTTEKDAVKVEGLPKPDLPVWAVRLQTEVIQGREQLEALIVERDE
ncbi:tetraacyldisaccharide 4'-kinase [Candidatus Nitrospira bockiana]